MKTITLRVSDTLADDVAAVAAALDITVSDLVRSALQKTIEATEPEGERGGSEPSVPTALTTVDRHQLALLHRVLALGEVDDSERDHHLGLAAILENGYTTQYSDVFGSLRSELPAREADLVMDVLDMFTDLEWSASQLSDTERAALGDERLFVSTFDGFDLNDRRESQLLVFARHLIAQGRWAQLADRFDHAHDRGNSHRKRADRYTRMLAAYKPIANERLRGLSGSDTLTLDDLIKVADAAVHPANR